MVLPSVDASLKKFLEMVANIFEAHTTALFIRKGKRYLEMVASHSLSNHLVEKARLRIGQGLIGWIAREGQRLHVTHFERDTRTLGIYLDDVGIKAFLAEPLPQGEGVLMVDSKNRYAFPEKKQRVLEDCAKVVYELVKAEKEQRELEFYRRLWSFSKELNKDPSDALVLLKEFLGADVGILAKRDGNSKIFRIKATVGLPFDVKLADKEFDIDKGLLGWIFRKKSHLKLNRISLERSRSYILYRGDPITKGSSFLGLYQEGKNHTLSWLFLGEMNFYDWPKTFEEMIVRALKCAIGEDR